MDMKNKSSVLLVLISLIHLNCVSGWIVTRPEKLKVVIQDGQVLVHWKAPAGAPSDVEYNVQMGRYIDPWSTVESCTGIKNTYCDLSRLVHDYRAVHKVQVQLVAGDDKSNWTSKKFSLTDSDLLPPSFNLWGTSTTLTVVVQEKPILREIFPYGVSYTIFLEERGQDNKTTTAYLNYDKQEDQRTKTFTSLHWGKEYCVSIKVQGNGAVEHNNMSSKHCLLLPEQEWYIMAVTSLSILSVLAVIIVIVAVLMCYLRRAEKTPAALKSPASGWLPLSVGEGTMEVVTDKGWFLSSYSKEVKDPDTQVMVTEDNGDEDRRTSLDSGLSIESNSAKTNRGSPLIRQEDSGCGSMGGPEGSTSGQTDYPMENERTDTDTVQKREDSGVGLGCQLDTGLLQSKPIAGGNYRSQSPPAVHIQVCDEEEEFKLILPDTALAEVVTGYRAGSQSCICSGSGQCTWCHKQGHYKSQVIKQYRPMCIENGLLGSKCDFVDSYKAGLTFPSYRRAQMDTVMVNDLEKTFIQLGENFPLLTALSPLHLGDGGQDFNMNNVSLSLCDVELNTD